MSFDANTISKTIQLKGLHNHYILWGEPEGIYLFMVHNAQSLEIGDAELITMKRNNILSIICIIPPKTKKMIDYINQIIEKALLINPKSLFDISKIYGLYITCINERYALEICQWKNSLSESLIKIANDIVQFAIKYQDRLK